MPAGVVLFSKQAYPRIDAYDPLPVNEHHYAVVVGINRYPGLSNLTGARSDAEAFAQWLVRPDGGALPAANIKRVMATDAEEAEFAADVGAAKPVREQIEDAIADAAAAARRAAQADPNAWARTRLYLYVAGHGLAPSGGEGALYLANAREGASRHLELAEYRKWCTRCAYFREVVVFADCCRTRVNTARALPPTLDDCAEPFDDRQTTWVVGYGSGLGDPTYENDARGYFTTALLEGLTNAKPDDSGAVTAEALGPFVKTAVADLSKDARHPQTAELYADAGARVVFRAQPPAARAMRQVTMSFPPGYAGRVELRFGRKPVGVHDAATGPWSLPLEDGLYEVAPAAGEPPAAFAEKGLFKVAGGDTDVQL
jgi:Caspase domain